MRSLPLLLSGLLLPVLAERTAAQGIHRVGPGYHPTIQAAIDAATAGEVVLIDAGVYPGFTVDKSLTITAESSALVQVVTTGPVGFVLPPAGRVHLGGLDVQADTVTITGGVVSIERCSLRTVHGLRLANSYAALRWSAATASEGSGVLVTNAHFDASDCAFGTAAGGAHGIEFGAIRFEGVSTGGLSQCTLAGAWPHTVLAPYPSAALHVAALDAPAECIWLVACGLVGGFDPNSRLGPSVVAPADPAPAPVRLHRCSTTGVVKGAVQAGPVAGLRSSAEARIGTTFTTTVSAEPGHLLIMYLAIDIIGPHTEPQVEQPSLGLIGLEILDFALGDANGEASFPLPLPNNPALQHLPLWWRGLDLLPSSPWQATPAFVTIVQ